MMSEDPDQPEAAPSHGEASDSTSMAESPETVDHGGSAEPSATPASRTNETPVVDRSARRTGRDRPKWLWSAIAVVIIIAIIAAAALSVENQPDYVSVEQAVTTPEKYMDHEVQVFGIVEEWNPSGSDHRFILNDTESTKDDYYLLEVDANDVPAPSSFGEHKGATVTGRLVYDDDTGILKLVASELRVGCPSKYEPEER